MRAPSWPDRLIAGLFVLTAAAAHARGEEPSPSSTKRLSTVITASRSVMVGVSGPRKGPMAARYFNVQGAERHPRLVVE